MTTRTWIGEHAGDPNSWDQLLNWSGGLIPIAGDDVIIGVATSEPILSADTVLLSSVTINAGANLIVGTFTLNALTVSNAGSITGSGTSSDGLHLDSGGHCHVNFCQATLAHR
jgi:hypothetical protein